MSGKWIIAAAALAGMAILTVGGCVSIEEHQRAVRAANLSRKAQLKAQEDLELARADIKQLRREMIAVGGGYEETKAYVKKLEAAKADLLSKFKTLEELYRKMAGRDKPIGGIVLHPELDAALKALQKQNPELMDYLPEHGMVKIKSDLTFGKGSAVVKATAVEAINKLAGIMNTETAAALNIYVAGHTDDLPLVSRAALEAHGSNWGLSLHRAGAVVKVLAQAGIAQPRLGAMGFSKYHPVAPNKPGNKGNPVNRRVEIWIVRPAQFLTAGPVAPEPDSEK